MLMRIIKCIGFILSHYKPAKAKCHCSVNTNKRFSQNLNTQLSSADIDKSRENVEGWGDVQVIFYFRAVKRVWMSGRMLQLCVCQCIPATYPGVLQSHQKGEGYRKTTCSRQLHTCCNNTSQWGVSPARDSSNFMTYAQCAAILVGLVM